MPTLSSDKRLLLIGASRGLGLALAEEYLKRGWHVVATERDKTTSKLTGLLERSAGRLTIEALDIVRPDQIDALRARLAAQRFDLLFVNAGVTNDDRETTADVSTAEFVRVMTTNALSPMRVVEALRDLVHPGGTIGIMSSGQGSISNNENGAHDIYRGSKAALNMFMRSFAARRAAERRTLLLMAPGWVRTDMGGSQARWASMKAYRTSQTRSTRRPGRRAFNIWTTSGARCRGERAKGLVAQDRRARPLVCAHRSPGGRSPNRRCNRARTPADGAAARSRKPQWHKVQPGPGGFGLLLVRVAPLPSQK